MIKMLVILMVMIIGCGGRINSRIFIIGSGGSDNSSGGSSSGSGSS